MSKKEKLIERFKLIPKDFTFDEMVSLLAYLGFDEIATGKTSGSRVRFCNIELQVTVFFHKPHPSNILCESALKEICNKLLDSELI